MSSEGPKQDLYGENQPGPEVSLSGQVFVFELC